MSRFEFMIKLYFFALSCSTLLHAYSTSSKQKETAMPPPFTRELYLSNPAITGNDVLIMCTLLSRDIYVQESYSNGQALLLLLFF